MVDDFSGGAGCTGAVDVVLKVASVLHISILYVSAQRSRMHHQNTLPVWYELNLQSMATKSATEVNSLQGKTCHAAASPPATVL